MCESWPLSEHCLTTRADVELQGIGRNRASRKYPSGNPDLGPNWLKEGAQRFLGTSTSLPEVKWENDNRLVSGESPSQ